MNLENFKASLHQDSPPAIAEALKALWWEAKGNWNHAHQIAQGIHTPEGSWVHAYLHRKEGDLSNASYWYSRADRKMPDIPLTDEWEEITQDLLNRRNDSK